MTNPISKQFLTFEQLNSMTKQELYDYCLIDGTMDSWEVDCTNEIVANIDKYGILKSFNGAPFNYIISKWVYTVETYLPVGKKLNARLLYSLENLIKQNKKECMATASAKKPTKYILDTCIKPLDFAFTAIEYADTLKQ